MRIQATNIGVDSLGEAIRIFIAESEKVSPANWPEVAKNLAAASFICGAQWGAGHPDPKSVLKQCKLGHELFNKMPE